MSTTDKDVQAIARGAIQTALAAGAREASATISRSRDVSVEWRDGKVERINEATRRSLTLQLYVDGRYSQAMSSDLRPEALKTFITDGVAMTRVLTEDPFRALPEPSLYQGRAIADRDRAGERRRSFARRDLARKFGWRAPGEHGQAE